MDRIRVLIADDHALLRQGLCRILELEGDIEVVAQAADGDEAVALTKEIRPDVVLMDINMPGLNGLEATQMIKDAAPDTRILVLTIHSDDEYVFQVLQAGASGYVLKDVDPANLAEAIRTVNKGALSAVAAAGEGLGGVWTAVPGPNRDCRGSGMAKQRQKQFGTAKPCSQQR